MSPMQTHTEDAPLSSEPPEPPERIRSRGVVPVAVAVEDGSRPDVSDALRCRMHVLDALSRLGFSAVPFDVRKGDFADAPLLLRRIGDVSPLVVFNLFEGFGDDSSLENVFCRHLDSSGVPYTGNGPDALALCRDKETARTRLELTGVPVPMTIRVRNPSDVTKVPFPSPYFVKPACEDGSVGIDDSSLVRDAGDLPRVVVEGLARYPEGLLVEEFLGGREFSAAFLEGDREPLGISVIDYARYRDVPPYLNYSSKWDPASPEYAIIPESADLLAPDVVRRVRDLAERAGTALGCRGYYRVDLRERSGDGDVCVIDVNPNPDISKDAGMARQASRNAIPYDALIGRIVDAALANGNPAGRILKGKAVKRRVA